MTRHAVHRLHATASRLRPSARGQRVLSTAAAGGKRLRAPTAACELAPAQAAVCAANATTGSERAASWRTLAGGVCALALATTAAAVSSHEDAAASCDARRDSRSPSPHLGGPSLSIHDAFEIADEVIGEGGYCVVHRGVDKRTGEAVAIKVLDKRETPAREFWTEVDVLRTASHHPNIMQLRGVFESENRWYIVQELASEGELFDHLIENGAYSENQASAAMRELCDALHYLHRKGIVHGDIKPENILLHNGHMCLVDFGVSFRVGEHFFADSQLTGTVAYAAPETLRNSHAAATESATATDNSDDDGDDDDGHAGSSLREHGLGPQADMFALGVVLYILLCGSHPFDPYNNLTDDEIRQRIIKGKFSKQTRTWQSMSPLARDLIEKLLETDPEARLTSAEAMQHPWLANQAELSHEPIRNSAELLERFQRGRRRLRASILGVLLMDMLENQAESKTKGFPSSSPSSKASESITMGISSGGHALNHKVDALLSTLDVFDREKKGFITKHDLARVSRQLGRHLSETELTEMLVGATGDPEQTDDAIHSIAYDDVKLAISTLRSASYDPGEVIIHQGQTGHHVFLLLDGEVEVSCKNPIKRPTEPLAPRKPTGGGLIGLLAPKQLVKTPTSPASKKKTATTATPTTPGATPTPDEEVTLKRLKKGSFFGEVELLRPDGRLHPRIATYKCAATKANGEPGLPCKVLQLVADDFLNVSDVYATINEKVESSARHHTQDQLIKCVEATKGSMKKRTLAPGEFVYHEGEECDSFFIIVSGEVEVLRQHDQIVVEQLKQGDYFPLGVSGMTSNCTIHNRHYSVRCTEPTTVIEIGGEAFRSFLHSTQFMASYFRQEIKSREQLRLEKHVTKPLN
jgi:serine/threonine protein kinase/CRP-like cAMP-binding protein